jgi:hypothetical protein
VFDGPALSLNPSQLGSVLAPNAAAVQSSVSAASIGQGAGKGKGDARTGSLNNPRDKVNLSATARDAMGEPLSQEEQKQVDELKKRDQEVRNHEEAHQRVGGQYASAPSYEYQQGPDGKNYAVGGQVQIDTAPVEGDPDATIAKMEIVKRAALAPAEPSGQDRAVAAKADAIAQQAQQEKMELERAAAEAAARGDPPPDTSAPGMGPSPVSVAAGATLGGYGPSGTTDVGGLLQLFA